MQINPVFLAQPAALVLLFLLCSAATAAPEAEAAMADKETEAVAALLDESDADDPMTAAKLLRKPLSSRVRRDSQSMRGADELNDQGRVPFGDHRRSAFPLEPITASSNECFFEIRVPKRVGGRCQQSKTGVPYCEVGSYIYRNHPDCY